MNMMHRGSERSDGHHSHLNRRMLKMLTDELLTDVLKLSCECFLQVT